MPDAMQHNENEQQDEKNNVGEYSGSKIRQRRTLWLGISALVLFLDQITKWAVMEYLMRPQISGVPGSGFLEWYTQIPDLLPYARFHITSFFNLVMAWNTGVSFSMLSNHGVHMVYFLIFIAMAITVLFAYWLWKAESHLQGICYALVIGGALGNVLDRARFGAVIDFLDFHFMGRHWPAFNIADSAIVCGISVLIIVSLFFDLKRKDRYRKQRKKRKDYQEFLRKKLGR